MRRFPEKPDLGRQPRINDLAHIIYTSGTTGHPKGALISYANLFANLNGIERIFKISKRDRFIVFLPMFHSFTLTAMVLLPIYMACSIIWSNPFSPFPTF
ncbi:long-chain-fatty-acid--CoA ligase [Neisseria gonorrhoeae]|uniref:Long-chain-fatty-acid--CoA ligase n=1 Tax=Neisseria gonorrhoeae TaxID=485 RepID=A0A378VYU8_NEIGO|nr:long-chain-fatty-acid--CoA ligase [Neisseria gonorrhoeae]